MPLPNRNTLAVIGAGPIGLECAAVALDAGLDVHVFERGEVADHVLAWGHVKMFTPWRMNLGPASRAHLVAAGATLPDDEACPSGAEYVEQALAPLAKTTELAQRIHTHAQVLHVSRRGLLKGDAIGKAERAEQPFRLLVRDQGGRESFLHAFAVVDASGVYGTPNWAGDGGIPARGELYLAPQMSYHLDDVLGLRRARYAGKRTLVIGAGASAANTVAALAQLAGEAPGTSVVWATRANAAALFPERADDPLPERRALNARSRSLVRGGNPAVTHIGGLVVEDFEYNSATHRYRVLLRRGEEMVVEEADQVIVNAGFGPDNSLYRELQVHECYASRGPMKLAAALLASSGAGGSAADCLDVPAFGADVLASPEPNFYIVGNKSYGRRTDFLLETGFKQVAEVVQALVAGVGAKTPA